MTQSLPQRAWCFWRSLSFPVRVSIVLQVAALPLLSISGLWPWVVAWLLLHHSVLSIAGTIPRSSVLGPNLVQIQSTQHIALTFDDGPDPEVTPAVLDILQRWQVRASFFVIGECVERHPELARAILAAGHTIENHTHRHSSWFSAYSPAKLEAECVTAQKAIASVDAPTPQYFRAPAGVRSAWLEPVLHKLGLRLAAWSRRGFDTSQSDPDRVYRRLTRNLSAGEILLLHDGNSARTSAGTPVVLEVLEPLLAEIDRLGLQAVPLPRT